MPSEPPKEIRWSDVQTPNQPHKKQGHLTAKDWEPYKDFIQGLHDQSTPIKEIVAIVSENFGLAASVSQMKHILKQWGKGRYLKLTTRQRVYIRAQKRVRCLNGKRSAFKFRDGSRIDTKNLDRVLKRNESKDTKTHRACSTVGSSNGIVAYTPANSLFQGSQGRPAEFEAVAAARGEDMGEFAGANPIVGENAVQDPLESSMLDPALPDIDIDNLPCSGLSYSLIKNPPMPAPEASPIPSILGDKVPSYKMSSISSGHADELRKAFFGTNSATSQRPSEGQFDGGLGTPRNIDERVEEAGLPETVTHLDLELSSIERPHGLWDPITVSLLLKSARESYHRGGFRHSLKICENIFQQFQNRPTLPWNVNLEVILGMGISLTELGYGEHGYEKLVEALKISQVRLGELHSVTIGVVNAVAVNFYARRNYREAFERYECVIASVNKMKEKDAVRELVALTGKCESLISRLKESEARDVSRDLLSDLERICGPSHPIIRLLPYLWWREHNGMRLEN